jgi:U3 small nucleolar RNA-associated protein 15
MPSYPGIKIKQYANVQERETSEAKYWKSYQTSSEDKLNSSPNCIDFCAALPNFYIVTGSTAVTMYNATTDKVQRAFSRFGDNAFSGRLRKDGKLIVAGDNSNMVQVFDSTSKAMLRQMKKHSGAVHSVCWSTDGINVISGSDDSTVKRWDLGTGQLIWDSKKSGEEYSHRDYVRCVSSTHISNDVFVSCCYDHTVKIWDSRQSKPVNTLNLNAPVETCMVTKSGAVLMTAAGNELQLWDMLSSFRPMHSFKSHQKNITSIALDSAGSRVLTAGLDGHVKVHSLHTLQVVHGMKFGSPITAIGLSPDNEKLLVGFVDGALIARNKKSTASGPPSGDSNQSSSQSQIVPSEQNRFYKGAGQAAERTEDGMVETERAVRLRPYEVQLKLFKYQGALDAALKTRNPLIIVTVLEELSRRSGLSIALSGRDESSLEPLLSFCARYVSNPRYSILVIQVVHVILDIYSSELGHSDSIDELFLKMRKQVNLESKFQREVLTVCGALDCIVNASSIMRDNDYENDAGAKSM